MSESYKAVINGQITGVDEIPVINWERFRALIADGVRQGERIASLFGVPAVSSGTEVCAVLLNDVHSRMRVLRSRIEDSKFASLTPDCSQAHLFERELAEQFALSPEGHPWLKPVRFTGPLVPGKDQSPPPSIGAMEYYRVSGEEVHEVAVGPVHAGVIEPGHFRFQCHGERVFHLEISLGYQHRGIEESLISGPHKATLRQIETVAGDTSVGHAWAYSRCIEGLSDLEVSPAAEVVRAIALELERLANHTGDLGALAGDVGYLPTMSYCGRIRGDFLNMTAHICGNRFGRSLVIPGGVRFGIDLPLRDKLLSMIDGAERDVSGAVELLWNSASVMARFEGTGILSREVAQELGLVGVAARASGLERDIRFTHPYGLYRYNLVPMALSHHGDVASRSLIRWLEIKRSIQLIRDLLQRIEQIDGDLAVPIAPLRPDSMVVSLVEGWRGEICHVAWTNELGKFRRYKVCDPSFHNWSGLALALREQQISDFPLCNKSFNLSYCGFDL